MRGLPHAIIGASCGIALSGGSVYPEVVGLAVLGSLLPDLDCDHATIQRIPIAGPLASIAVRLVVALVSVVRPVQNPFPSTVPRNILIHRGPWHTPLSGALIAFACMAVGMPAMWATALVVGFLSHLLADQPTKMGIAWLWPVYTKTLRLPVWLSFRSGSSLIEWPLAVGALLVVTWLLR